MKRKTLISRLLVSALVMTGLAACAGSGDPAPTADSEPAAQAESAAETGETASAKPASDKDRIAQHVRERMKALEGSLGVMDSRAAVDIAMREARKWDRSARLYRLDGEDKLTSDGTARKWRAYFAVREDPPDTPRREQGKKFIAIVMAGKVVSANPEETPEDISHTAECTAFLPPDRMDATAAFIRCYAALKDRLGDDADRGSPERLECLQADFYEGAEKGWVGKPAWRLTLDMQGSPVSAMIHAKTGEVVVKK